MTRLLAFYLPQFHEIPENNAWWGQGFTEWTNVRSARPRFPGHAQPKLPAGENYYDLARPEVLREQARLAREHGISGFIFYHYWFKGRRLLQTPLANLLADQDCNLSFALCWANESWTRRWDGREDEVLIRQEYSQDDDLEHIRALLPVFRDQRYIKIADRPLLLLYRSEQLPNAAATAALWRREARAAGFPDLFLLRVESLTHGFDPADHGCDGAVEFAPDWRCLTRRVYPDSAAAGGWTDTPGAATGAGARENKIYLYDEVV
ncbi:MAG: glycoside hydrolase family 99-like domain-containing protein, partial [Deltaproteobacteria bacterium]|nr:glycoside hydrolase family 99-like domain-containing protein [Deltaproteobacteria bacterium]